MASWRCSLWINSNTSGENGYGAYLAKKSLRELGRAAWERHVHEAMKRLKAFSGVDYVVLGGGNIDQLERVPKAAVLTDQDAAFAGGRLLWDGRRPVLGEAAVLHWKKSVLERGGLEHRPLERLMQVPRYP